MCNQKRQTHHRYAFSPRGFERKQLILILCEHKFALIFTLVADDLTNRCWVLTKTRLRLQKSVHFVHFKNGNVNLNVQFTLYVRTDFIISPSFDEWSISHSRATLAPLLLKVSLPHLIVILLHGPVMLS